MEDAARQYVMEIWPHIKFGLLSSKLLNLLPSKAFPIDDYRLALDRVKSISALSAHSTVKGLIIKNVL